MAKKAVRELILKAKDQGIKGIQKNVNGLQSDVKGLRLSWSSAGKAAGVAAGAMVAAAAGSAVAVGAVGKSFIATGSQVEQYQIKLKTVLRDSEKAQRVFKGIVDFAARTPFEIPGLVDASIQLEAFGLNALENLDAVGDAAAAMGEDALTAAMAVTQGMTGEMEMLKRFTITSATIQEKLGKPIDRKTVEGQRQLVEAILAVMRDKFGGGMEDMAKSWRGTMSMFSDHLFNLKYQMARGGFFDTVKADLQEVLKFVDRFKDEGGVDAIALGFNNAFKSVHEAFFAPMFSSLDDVKFSVGLLALQVEDSFLKIALTLNDTWTILDRFKEFGFDFTISAPGLAEAKNIIKTMKEISEIGEVSWDAFTDAQIKAGKGAAEFGGEMIKSLTGVRAAEVLYSNLRDQLFAAGGSSDKLRAQIVDLSLAMRVLRGDTTLTIEEMSRGFQAAQERGLFDIKPSVEDKADEAGDAGRRAGAAYAKGMTFGVENNFDLGKIRLKAPEFEYELPEFKYEIPEFKPTGAAKVDTSGFFAGIETPKLGVDLEPKGTGLDPEGFQLDLATQTDAWIAYLKFKDENEELFFEQSQDRTLRWGMFYVSELELIADATERIFYQMGKYHEIFTRKGMNLGRAFNAMMIRGFGEVAKFGIEALTRKIKFEAKVHAADALVLLAQGNLAGAAAMAAAAAKKGALVGLGGIASALIEREISSREEALTGRIDTMPAEYGGTASGRGRSYKGSATTVRTGQQVNNFYISLTNNVQGDYKITDGNEVTVEQIQRLFDEGVVQVPH